MPLNARTTGCADVESPLFFSAPQFSFWIPLHENTMARWFQNLGLPQLDGLMSAMPLCTLMSPKSGAGILVSGTCQTLTVEFMCISRGKRASRTVLL